MKRKNPLFTGAEKTMNDTKKKELVEKILELKKERDMAILAHYYVEGDLQEVADYIGDSFYLSKIGREIPNKNLIMCGVTFMGDTVKLLSPEKTVLYGHIDATCPMADMVTVEEIRKVKEEYDDLAVVCYVNSNMNVKAECDVCVTSANALKVVSELREKNIYFIPDGNLGGYIQEKLPEKNFILAKGYCPVHHFITPEGVEAAKKAHPNAPVLVHPECKKPVTDMADYAGSTTGILDYIRDSEKKEFIVVTEEGIFHKAKALRPDAVFYTAEKSQICDSMKLMNLENIYETMRDMKPQVELDKETSAKAVAALEKMLELAGK